MRKSLPCLRAASAFGHHALPHAEPRAAPAPAPRPLPCPSPRTPRENCAYVPARTQTRAAPILSCAMCDCPVLAPHGRPAPPAPATRPSHHQSKPHIHSRRDARAAAHLTSTTSPFCALCRLCTLLLASHKRLYQDAPRVRRRFCTTQGTHARPHPRARARARSSAQSAAQPDSLPAHTSYSTMCTHCAQRCSPHPATTACPPPHHDVSRTLRQQPSQRHCSARLCTPAVPLRLSQSTPSPRLPGHAPQQ